MIQAWQHHNSLNVRSTPRASSLALAFAVAIAMAAPAAQAQTFQVIHRFTGGADGANPIAGGITSDSQGNLYGTAGNGGIFNANCLSSGVQVGCGTVFKLSPKSGG